MENKLKKLFDYQRFEQNEHLARLIAETEARQAAEISDEDLAFVAAAGELDITADEHGVPIRLQACCCGGAGYKTDGSNGGSVIVSCGDCVYCVRNYGPHCTNPDAYPYIEIPNC